MFSSKRASYNLISPFHSPCVFIVMVSESLLVTAVLEMSRYFIVCHLH